MMATLTQLRERTGKTRARVAAELDMSERHLYRLEKGDSPLRRITALAFAEYYGVPVDEIETQHRRAS